MELPYGFATLCLWPCKKVKARMLSARADYSELVFFLLVKLYCNVNSVGRCRFPQPSHPDDGSSKSVSVAPSLCKENNGQQQFHS